jgi:hypothetical protein
MNIVLIWWLSQEDCEQLQPVLDKLPIPQYIKDEFWSRFGRPGRGRLWVPKNIDFSGFPWDSDKPLAKAAEKCGGVVIDAADVRYVACLPGFVTDSALELATLL